LPKPETLSSVSSELASQIHNTHQHGLAKVLRRFLEVNQFLAHAERRSEYRTRAKTDIEELRSNLLRIALLHEWE
jgi:hypothetical protein